MPVVMVVAAAVGGSGGSGSSDRGGVGTMKAVTVAVLVAQLGRTSSWHTPKSSCTSSPTQTLPKSSPKA